MKTTQELIQEINKKDKELDYYRGMCRELVLYLKDFNIFPPDMTEKEKELYYQFKGYKPDWSMFMQMWSHYLTGTWESYKEALREA